MEMQSVLYQIKNLDMTGDSSIDEALNAQAQEIITQSLAALNANRKGRNKLTAQ
jgi:hypothetical protein